MTVVSVTLITHLTWHDARTARPEDDEPVLLWLHNLDQPPTWESGWHDGDHWRLCESGGIADGHVLYWARPVGPNAQVTGAGTASG